jgi:hypothetical protein
VPMKSTLNWPPQDFSRMIARRLKLNREMEVVLLVAALSCGFTSCLTWPNDAIGSKEPDRILFDRAVSAAEYRSSRRQPSWAGFSPSCRRSQGLARSGVAIIPNGSGLS